MHKLIAQGAIINKTKGGTITNPALQGVAADPTAAKTGASTLLFFLKIWLLIINIGALMLVLYFLWGAIDWITSGGDSGKVASARNKMVQAVIGMLILASSFILIGFINSLFFEGTLNLLELSIPTL